MTRAEETQTAVREAMAKYNAIVLHEKNFDSASQSYRYPHAISVAEVLRMAGVRSRTTLTAHYHDALRRELEVFVETLKQKAGKGKAAKKVVDETKQRVNREEQLAQSIVALQYKVLSQEKELERLRKSGGTDSTVVNMPRNVRGAKVPGRDR